MSKNIFSILTLLFILFCSSCKKKEADIPQTPITTIETISKPKGIFSSAGATSNAVLNHNETRGVLIRAYWWRQKDQANNYWIKTQIELRRAAYNISIAKMGAEGLIPQLPFFNLVSVPAQRIKPNNSC